MPSLSIDRCAVLLAAGLVGDALAEADAAVGRDRAGPRPVQQEGRAATCSIGGQLRAGRSTAAGGMTRDQPSPPVPLAAQRLVAGPRQAGALPAQSVRRRGRCPAQLLRRGEPALPPVWLEALGSSQSAQAHLLAGRVALDLGRAEDADRHFVAAARGRRRGAALSRASGWLSAALRAQAAGDPRRMLGACRRGLAVLDEHRFTLGATELRAQATAHGAELAALAQRHAALARRPRLLLAWSERWRATANTVPAVRPLADAELNADLAALRQVTEAQLDQVRRQDAPNALPARAAPARAGTAAARGRRCGASALRAHRGSPGQRRARPWPAIAGTAGPARLRPADRDRRHRRRLARCWPCEAWRVRQFTAGRIGRRRTGRRVSPASRCAACARAGLGDGACWTAGRAGHRGRRPGR